MPHGPGSHPCDGESFDGTDRKASKIKPSTAAVEDFENLSDFIDTLASDDDMGVNHTPAIGTGATSTRVTEEKRNVHIASAWLYTFSREGDEDFHVIIGTTNDKETATFFNAEISGLPGNSASAFAALNEARTTFKDFFGLTQCSSGYTADMARDILDRGTTHRGLPPDARRHRSGHAARAECRFMRASFRGRCGGPSRRRTGCRGSTAASGRRMRAGSRGAGAGSRTPAG